MAAGDEKNFFFLFFFLEASRGSIFAPANFFLVTFLILPGFSSNNQSKVHFPIAIK